MHGNQQVNKIIQEGGQSHPVLRCMTLAVGVLPLVIYFVDLVNRMAQSNGELHSNTPYEPAAAQAPLDDLTTVAHTSETQTPSVDDLQSV